MALQWVERARCAQVAIRLHEDLEVNLPGAELALDLLEDIDALKHRSRN